MKADYQAADERNPALPFDYRSQGQDLSVVQQQFRHVYDMMALGNTTLFLDVFPLHEFYAKRGWREFEECLGARESIHGHPKFPVLWPVGQEQLKFGQDHIDILQGFSAIEAGDIPKSVEHLAWHEQQNILQPTIYSDLQLVALLRGNHISYVTGIPSGVAQAIELTLTSQCERVTDGRTIEFSDNRWADLSDLSQRMPFVLRAASSFDRMLKDSNRSALEQSIREIAGGES